MNDSLWQETLGTFQESVGAPQPMPAGVATAAVSAALGLSLLVKVLRIRGIRPDLLRSAQELIEELRAVADADIAAIRAYLQHRDTKGLNEVPARAQHAVGRCTGALSRQSVCKLVAVGVYAPRLVDKQIKLLTEKDLHYKVMDCVRKRFPKFGVVIPRLGELQDSQEKRADAWKKGYKGGQPDLLIPIPSGDYNGLAIELKTPNGTGTTSQNQMDVL